nr:PREDICTED: protein crumbs-like [Linepithema humile]
MEDVIINGEWDYSCTTLKTVYMEDVESGCPREAQCSPNPCENGGHCTDNWREFKCKCERPYLGRTCQYNMTFATFGYENITNGYVTVKVIDTAKRTVSSVVDICMFIRTREGHGDIFYLDTDPQDDLKLEDKTCIRAQLKDGNLRVSFQFDITDGYTIDGARLNDENNTSFK